MVVAKNTRRIVVDCDIKQSLRNHAIFYLAVIVLAKSILLQEF